MEDLSDEVEQLKRRVSFLERELETSYEKDRFDRFVDSVFPDSATIESRGGDFGPYARITNIDGDDVEHALTRVEDTKYECAVTETGNGLGMEVFTYD